MRRIARLVLAVLLAACSRPTETSIGQVDLTVRPERLATGDSVTASLVNRSGVTLEYSFCPAALERRMEGGWYTVQQPFGVSGRSMCLGILSELPPGGTAEYRQLVTEDVDAGLYRLRINVGTSDGDTRLSSSEFRVIG